MGSVLPGNAQLIPLDTSHWEYNARSYVLESFEGQNAVYLQGGNMTLRENHFLNGTIEFDVYLREVQAFPGVYFRVNEESANAEQFYIRPHQSGNPDANQTAPLIQGVTPWQLYYGPRYSFPYQYKFDDWTHVRIVVLDSRAQVFLDHSTDPHLSWQLFHQPSPGGIVIRGGNQTGLHIANVKISAENPELVNFSPVERAPIEGAIEAWEISDKFEEKMLDNPNDLEGLINSRSWQGRLSLAEGVAADISQIQQLNDGNPGNTVLAKVIIRADQEGIRLFEFGYSDRVVAILNGIPVYRGNNRWLRRTWNRACSSAGKNPQVWADPNR